MRNILVIAVLASVLTGCLFGGGSTPTSGGACSKEGDFVCDPEDRFWGFECNDGKWRDVACSSGGDSRYPWGCYEEEFGIQCQVNQVRANDPCWTKFEGTEMCSILLDQRDIKLTCTDGVWVSTPCVTCQKPSGYPIACMEE